MSEGRYHFTAADGDGVLDVALPAAEGRALVAAWKAWRAGMPAAEVAATYSVTGIGYVPGEPSGVFVDEDGEVMECHE